MIRTDGDPIEWGETKSVTKKEAPVTKPVTGKRPVLHAVAGKPCPLCGHKVPEKIAKTPAERQKAAHLRRKSKT